MSNSFLSDVAGSKPFVAKIIILLINPMKEDKAVIAFEISRTATLGF